MDQDRQKLRVPSWLIAKGRDSTPPPELQLPTMDIDFLESFLGLDPPLLQPQQRRNSMLLVTLHYFYQKTIIKTSYIILLHLTTLIVLIQASLRTEPSIQRCIL